MYLYGVQLHVVFCFGGPYRVDDIQVRSKRIMTMSKEDINLGFGEKIMECLEITWVQSVRYGISGE